MVEASWTMGSGGGAPWPGMLPSPNSGFLTIRCLATGAGGQAAGLSLRLLPGWRRGREEGVETRRSWNNGQDRKCGQELA